MPETTARIAAALLALTFAWAGIAKFVAFQAWSTALAGYRFPAVVERPARVAVPIVELAVALAIVIGQARVGAALALASVALFSFALVRGRAIHGDRLPCGCFGGRDERSATGMMWRNGLLALLAVGVLTAERAPSVFAGFRLPTGSELVAGALLVAGLVTAAWLAWQVSNSLRRRQAP